MPMNRGNSCKSWITKHPCGRRRFIFSVSAKFGHCLLSAVTGLFLRQRHDVGGDMFLLLYVFITGALNIQLLSPHATHRPTLLYPTLF